MQGSTVYHLYQLLLNHDSETFKQFMHVGLLQYYMGQDGYFGDDACNDTNSYVKPVNSSKGYTVQCTCTHSHTHVQMHA